MRKWWALLAIVLLAACSSTSANGSSNAPAGADQATWDDYCRHGTALLQTVSDASKGVNTADETVSRLTGAQNGIAGDATGANEPAHSQMQAVADAIGRVKVTIASGNAADFSELISATGALPHC